jgi:hypothetical protein
VIVPPVLELLTQASRTSLSTHATAYSTMAMFYGRRAHVNDRYSGRLPADSWIERRYSNCSIDIPCLTQYLLTRWLQVFVPLVYPCAAPHRRNPTD